MRSFAVNAATAVVLLALVFLASLSTPLGVIGLILCIGVIFLAVLGPEKFGTTLIMAGMFLAPQDSLRPVASFVLTFSDLFFVLGFALLLPRLLTREARVPVLFVAGAFGVLITSVVTSLLADAPAQNLSVALRFIGAAILLPAGFLLWSPSLKTVDRLAWAYVLGQVMSTVYAFLGGPLENGRYEGTSTHANFFAFGGLLAAVALFHLYHRVDPKHRWRIWAVAAICAYSVSMSGSRGALLSLILIAVLYPMVERSILSAYFLLAGVIFMVPMLTWLLDTFATGESALGRLLGNDATDYSDSTRTDALARGVDRFWSSPIIGSGFTGLLETHNIFLQVAVATGVLGLGAWLVLLVPFMSPLLGDHELRRLGYITLAYLAMGMTEPSLWERSTWAPMSLALLATLQPLNARLRGAGRDGDAVDAPEIGPATATRPGTGGRS